MTEKDVFLYQREAAILGVTELICEVMETQKVSRSELAKRLGRSKGYVTKFLDGQMKMDVRVISDILVVLGCAIRFESQPLTVFFRKIN